MAAVNMAAVTLLPVTPSLSAGVSDCTSHGAANPRTASSLASQKRTLLRKRRTSHGLSAKYGCRAALPGPPIGERHLARMPPSRDSSSRLLVPALGTSAAMLALWLGCHVDPAIAAESLHQTLDLHPKAPVDQDLTALALGPEGPLLEEFWDNVSRYVAYFFTVASGGAYSILKPVADLLRSPVTAVFTVVFIAGVTYLTYLTVSAMLGLEGMTYQYDYVP